MIRLHEPISPEVALDNIKDILANGQLINGKYTKQFEDKFAKYCDSKHCVTTSNGTDALFLALKVSNIKKGDSVLVPAITFFATVEAVLHVGAKPIFVDIDNLTWCMSYKDMINKFDDSVKACIPVHLFGQPCHQIEDITYYCKSMGITLIEDCAQAHGATIEGRIHEKVGSFGKMAIFSFMATKNLTCGGEGGAVVMQSIIYDKKLRLLKQHGMSDRHTHAILGYNSKMSEIECAIAIRQLALLDFNNDIRIENSTNIRNRLASISWLQPQLIPGGTKNVFFWCAFRVDEKTLGKSTEWLVQELFDQGIEVRYRYLKPLYDQPVIKTLYGEKKHYCPIADQTAGKLIGLPNHPALKTEDIEEIIGRIQKIDENK